MSVYECNVCGHLYDEEKEGVPFSKLADDWVCPICEAKKSDFAPVDA
jgi:rubredoxin